MNNDRYGGIKPNDISLEPDHPILLPLSSRFGKCEMDHVAYLIVVLLNKKNCWDSFTLDEIIKVGHEVNIGDSDYFIIEGLDHLTCYHWLKYMSNKTWEVNPNFVERCMKAQT